MDLAKKPKRGPAETMEQYKARLALVAQGEPSCGNCPFYRRSAEQCWRFPETVAKGEDDVCGEHPDFFNRSMPL